MKPAVAARFLAFTEPLEGLVEYMYVDIKNLVTIGFGNLIDPIGAAQSLPFVRKDGSGSATRTEITAEWNLIKDLPGKTRHLASKGHKACKPLTRLMLTRAAINDLCKKKLQSNETILKKVKDFQKFDDWPADAQLALHSMAWAMGPAFASGGKWPGFRLACGKMDFDTAAAKCKISEAGNPGLIPRNRADKQLFSNAAAVLAGEGDFYSRDILYYPTVLMKPVLITA